jgi:hypothetical protein
MRSLYTPCSAMNAQQSKSNTHPTRTLHTGFALSRRNTALGLMAMGLK